MIDIRPMGHFVYCRPPHRTVHEVEVLSVRDPAKAAQGVEQAFPCKEGPTDIATVHMDRSARSFEVGDIKPVLGSDRDHAAVDHVNFWMGAHVLHSHREMIGFQFIIRIQKCNEVTLRHCNPDIPRQCQSAILLPDRNDAWFLRHEAVNDPRSAIGTAVIDNDKLPVFVRLPLNRIDRARQEICPIVRAENNAHKRRDRWRCYSTTHGSRRCSPIP